MEASRLAVPEAAASIVRQRVSPPTVTQVKPIGRAMTPFLLVFFSDYVADLTPDDLLLRKSLSG